jgi:hypothetical protein
VGAAGGSGGTGEGGTGGAAAGGVGNGATGGAGGAGGTVGVSAGTFDLSNSMSGVAQSAAGIMVLSQNSGIAALVQQSVNVQANLNVGN